MPVTLSVLRKAIGRPGAPGPGSASLLTVARAWTRIGATGFGGPPAHIALLRALVVDRRGWLDARAFEDANAACGLLPGPASTQLAIYCAYRAGGPAGAIVGGLGFVLPAVLAVLALSAVFLAHAPPLWIRGAGAGAGAAVAAVAVHAARGLIGPSLDRVRGEPARVLRWITYLTVGLLAAALIGPYLVLVLIACGASEMALSRRGAPRRQRPGPRGRRSSSVDSPQRPFAAFLPAGIAHGGLSPLAWTAFKVGALSFGGGFVIIPLMQGDAVHAYHWMSNARFLDAVALGQVTPGPVVATVAAVGYAAHGIVGGALAATVAFLPSFTFVLLGGARFERLRGQPAARSFLDGAGPAAIGAILGAAVTLAGALSQWWQLAILACTATALLALHRGIVPTLLAAALVGMIAALAGAGLP